jgi:hypothetical protein
MQFRNADKEKFSFSVSQSPVIFTYTIVFDQVNT